MTKTPRSGQPFSRIHSITKPATRAEAVAAAAAGTLVRIVAEFDIDYHALRLVVLFNDAKQTMRSYHTRPFRGIGREDLIGAAADRIHRLGSHSSVESAELALRAISDFELTAQGRKDFGVASGEDVPGDE